MPNVLEITIYKREGGYKVYAWGRGGKDAWFGRKIARDLTKKGVLEFIDNLFEKDEKHKITKERKKKETKEGEKNES